MKRNACFTSVSFYTLNVTMNYITKRFTHILLTFLANTHFSDFEYSMFFAIDQIDL